MDNTYYRCNYLYICPLKLIQTSSCLSMTILKLIKSYFYDNRFVGSHLYVAITTWLTHIGSHNILESQIGATYFEHNDHKLSRNPFVFYSSNSVAFRRFWRIFTCNLMIYLVFFCDCISVRYFIYLSQQSLDFTGNI